MAVGEQFSVCLEAPSAPSNHTVEAGTATTLQTRTIQAVCREHTPTRVVWFNNGKYQLRDHITAAMLSILHRPIACSAR